jgi:hypothetical protein
MVALPIDGPRLVVRLLVRVVADGCDGTGGDLVAAHAPPWLGLS